jgi:hypothetical protein
MDLLRVYGVPAGGDPAGGHHLPPGAPAAGKPVTIHVEVFNPAMRLYERLGFRPIEERGSYSSWSGVLLS